MAALPEEQLGSHHCFHFPVLRWLKGDCPLLPSPGKKPTDFQPPQPAPLFCLISCRDFLPFPRLPSRFVQIHPQDVGSQQCNVHLRIPVFPTQWNPEPRLSKCFKCKAMGTLFLCCVFFLQHLKTHYTLPWSSCCASKAFLKEDSLEVRG